MNNFIQKRPVGLICKIKSENRSKNGYKFSKKSKEDIKYKLKQYHLLSIQKIEGIFYTKVKWVNNCYLNGVVFLLFVLCSILLSHN